MAANNLINIHKTKNKDNASFIDSNLTGDQEMQDWLKFKNLFVTN